MMILTALLVATGDVPTLRQRLDALPRPLGAFVERRADCNHWTGEEPYDAQRRAEIERAIRDLRCARIEKDEQRIRHRYRGNAAAIAILDETADLPGID
jgi:hypothetical protein